MAMQDGDWAKLMEMLRDNAQTPPNISITEDGRSALHMAARATPTGPERCDQLQLIVELLRAGANVNNSSNDEGTTPLMEAVASGNVHAMYHLLKYGFDAADQEEKIKVDQPNTVRDAPLANECKHLTTGLAKFGQYGNTAEDIAALAEGPCQNLLAKEPVRVGNPRKLFLLRPDD